MTPDRFEIIYQDEHIIAINKPQNVIVHKTNHVRAEDVYALQILRKQIKTRVFPVHRLDKNTTGVLIFGLSSEVAHKIHSQIIDQQTIKKYHCLLNNKLDSTVTCNEALKNNKGKVQNAETLFDPIKQFSYQDQKGIIHHYTYCQAIPKTGRMHQIRKHASILGFPIIADGHYGYHKENKLLKRELDVAWMLLHAKSYTLQHPITAQEITLEAALSPHFKKVLRKLENEQED